MMMLAACHHIIQASDLKGMVKKLLPKAKAHDALYFQVMINIQGEDWLTYQVRYMHFGVSLLA